MFPKPPDEETGPACLGPAGVDDPPPLPPHIDFAFGFVGIESVATFPGVAPAIRDGVTAECLGVDVTIAPGTLLADDGVMGVGFLCTS